MSRCVSLAGTDIHGYEYYDTRTRSGETWTKIVGGGKLDLLYIISFRRKTL